MQVVAVRGATSSAAVSTPDDFVMTASFDGLVSAGMVSVLLCPAIAFAGRCPVEVLS